MGNQIPVPVVEQVFPGGGDVLPRFAVNFAGFACKPALPRADGQWFAGKPDLMVPGI